MISFLIDKILEGLFIILMILNDAAKEGFGFFLLNLTTLLLTAVCSVCFFILIGVGCGFLWLLVLFGWLLLTYYLYWRFKADEN